MTKNEIIGNTNTQLSHLHGCAVEGHYYQCSEEDCECICGLPMNGHDHSDCPIELRPCPEHKAEQERRMAEAMSCETQTEIKLLFEEGYAARPHCDCGCSDIDPGMVVGFCLHCDHVYANYTPELENRHFANHCPDVHETLKEAARARLAKRVM